nr:transposase (putative), gypsy type [Tanacetum cinerariifolium]
LPDLIPTQMTLKLANRAICTPDGIARDVFIPVGKFTFLADFVVVDYESDPRVPLILGRPFLRIARALIDVHGEEMIIRDGDERLTLNMKHDTTSYSNHPYRESVKLINIFNFLSEDCLKDLVSHKQSGNPTFSLHKEIASPEVIHEFHDSKGCTFLSEELPDSDSFNDIHPHFDDDPLCGSTTFSANLLLEEFADELALISYPLDYDDNQMFTNEQTPDYSFPSRFDVYPDDFLEIESDVTFDNDSFDSEWEKINEAELLNFTSEYGIPETLHPALPGPEDRIVDFPEDIDLFNLIRAPNPTKVKTRSRPRAPHEVPLLTLTAPRVIKMDEPTATDSSGVPSTIERSPLDFSHEVGASDQGIAALEMPSPEDVPATAATGAGQAEETTTMDPPAALESCKRGRDGPDVNAPPNSLRKDHADPRPLGSSHGGRVLLLYNWVWRLLLCPKMLLWASPGSVYQPEWGVTNGSLLDTPEACQDLVDHVAPPGYFFELHHMHNEEFLRQYNVNLARQARELEIRNLEASLKTEANAKRAVEDKIAGLSQELKRMRAQFSDLQVSNERPSQQVATLQQQVSGEEKLKVAFEEFKQQQDERVEQRCAEMDARLDALSIDFDEELYPYMLTAIAGSRWVIGRGPCLVVMKCGESLELRQAFADAVSAGIAKGLSKGLRHGLEHGQAQRSLESIEAYDPKAEAKFVAALQALKDLKYPLVDQLEGLKDAPMDVIMAALYLESDTGDDAS